ncbi:MAG TPA: HPF/RaiA family ribosome-associated protein [Bacteroidales bacterium]|nr:HPF/RaiA family ribosome-associated protein [Bacteroidales bacterium]HQI45456.1 HPF/RaiA family ribosome-associated protein [Bacteroidales bacterium]
MKINISSIHFKADQKLEGFIQEKLNKLSTIYEGVLGSEVTLKIDKDEKMENKIAEIKLFIKGNDLFAKKQSKSFEESADNAIDALKTQLIKRKDKIKGI